MPKNEEKKNNRNILIEMAKSGLTNETIFTAIAAGGWVEQERDKTNPKSKSVLLLLLLLSCVIVLLLLLLLLVLGNSVVSFICARIDFYVTYFCLLFCSFYSPAPPSGWLSTHTIENSIDLQNELATAIPLSLSISFSGYPFLFSCFSRFFFIYFHFGFYERHNNFWALLGFLA